VLNSFAPILGDNPKVLILGSMPSVKSLQVQQYYAHPRNAFWWIMAQMLGFSVELPYSDRVKKLEGAGVAVWDVLLACHRKGSLDSSIARESEAPNDIDAFLQRNSSIEFVGFNGAAAKVIYKRHNALLVKKYTNKQLPSTSPAYASITKLQKLQIWQEIMLPYIK